MERHIYIFYSTEDSASRQQFYSLHFTHIKTKLEYKMKRSWRTIDIGHLLLVSSSSFWLCPYYAQELQQGQSTLGSSPPQSVTNTPRTPGGLVLFRKAHTSEGITPVISLSLRNAIPVWQKMKEKATLLDAVKNNIVKNLSNITYSNWSILPSHSE